LLNQTFLYYYRVFTVFDYHFAHTPGHNCLNHIWWR